MIIQYLDKLDQLSKNITSPRFIYMMNSENLVFKCLKYSDEIEAWYSSKCRDLSLYILYGGISLDEMSAVLMVLYPFHSEKEWVSI